MPEELTITRALAELKLLNKRIAKLIANTTFVSVQVSNKHWDDHVASTKANMQAITDLEERYSKIVSAIAKSNANTVVTVGNRQYTVIEAIKRKETIELHHNALLNVLRQQRNSALTALDSYERSQQNKLDNLLDSSFPKDQPRDPTEVENMTQVFRNGNWVKLVDPLEISKLIEKMSDDVDEFIGNVDFVLSESNAVTKITI